MSCVSNSWFKKNPWLAERRQVTTRWGKKSPTFDEGDDSMEVLHLNPTVCVCFFHTVNECVCLITNWPPAHKRPHSSAWRNLSQSKTLRHNFLCLHAALDYWEHRWLQKTGGGNEKKLKQ